MTTKILNETGLSRYDNNIKEYINNHAVAGAQSNWDETDSSSLAYIQNKPTLGTASEKDVATSGNASSTQVVMGNDSRLSDARPASDVSEWAKASTKPTYAASEVTFNNTGTSMTATNVQAAITELEASSGSDDSKMDKTNPTGTGFFSLNRKAGTTVGDYSFAEGSNTTASGNYSHAEGATTVATGHGSHAEGFQTIASGIYSHAEGSNTTANHASQHVFGEHNIADPSASSSIYRGNYVEIVGNGNASARSNARTLDWSGNEHIAGSYQSDALTAGKILVSDNDKNIVSDTLATSDLITTSNIGSQSVANATKWNNVVYDMSTANTTDTWIPVLTNGKFQHRVLAVTAGSATQPIYMVNGNVVACTYTLGKSVPSNAVFTDTNTWRGIQNNLTSTSTTESLSAYQGKWLNDNKIAGTSNGSGYYNVTKINTFTDTANALIQGGKGNYIWGISSWSDARLKKNIENSSIDALDVINQIQLRKFDFIDEKFGKHKEIGYIAQELMEVIPACVEEVELPDEDKEKYGVESMYQVEDKYIIPYLVKAIQEQQNQIDELEQRIKLLS